MENTPQTHQKGGGAVCLEPLETESYSRRAAIRRKLEAVIRQANEALEMLNGSEPKESKKRGATAGDLILTLLSAPGGLKRKQAEVAERLRMNIRTVTWAMAKLVEHGHVAKEGTRYSSQSALDAFTALSPEDQTEALVFNELCWRFGNPAWRPAMPYSTGLEFFTGGDRKDLLVVIDSLVEKGKVVLGPDGKIVRPPAQDVSTKGVIDGGDL